MQYRLNIDELLKIAIRIEKNGYEFYLMAAERFPAHADWLTELAEQETQHEAIFKKFHEVFVTEEESKGR